MENVINCSIINSPDTFVHSNCCSKFVDENGKLCWPTSTNVACYHHGEQFAGIPVPIPRDYDTERKHYKVWGNFCSLNCAKAWIIDHRPHSSREMFLLAKMANDVFCEKNIIIPAPPVTTLRKYGGYLDMSEFLSKSKNGVEISSHEPPFVSFEMVHSIKDRTVRERPVDKVSDFPELPQYGTAEVSTPEDQEYGQGQTMSYYKQYLEENSKKSTVATAANTKRANSSSGLMSFVKPSKRTKKSIQ